MEVHFRKPLLVLASILLTSSLWAETEIDARLRKIKGKTMAERVDSASLALLGMPYVESPLGDGPGSYYDEGPLYRFDGFDCTTFVETSLALAAAHTSADFHKRLQKIRYSGKTPSFTERNHFPCVDWIPHNTKSGLMTDITDAFGKPWGVEKVTTPINKKGWFENLPLSTIRASGIGPAEAEKRWAKLKSEGARYAAQSPALSYLPLSKIIIQKEISEAERERRKQEETALVTQKREELRRAPKSESDDEKKIHNEVIDLRLRYLIEDTEVDPAFLASIPHSTILSVVRPGWKIPGTVLNISHQGLVIRKKNGVYFRHVNKRDARAKDVPLANYLRLCLLIPAIKGINLLRINDI